MKCPFGTFAVTSGTVDCESGCFSFFGCLELSVASGIVLAIGFLGTCVWLLLVRKKASAADTRRGSVQNYDSIQSCSMRISFFSELCGSIFEAYTFVAVSLYPFGLHHSTPLPQVLLKYVAQLPQVFRFAFLDIVQHKSMCEYIVCSLPPIMLIIGWVVAKLNKLRSREAIQWMSNMKVIQVVFDVSSIAVVRRCVGASLCKYGDPTVHPHLLSDPDIQCGTPKQLLLAGWGGIATFIWYSWIVQNVRRKSIDANESVRLYGFDFYALLSQAKVLLGVTAAAFTETQPVVAALFALALSFLLLLAHGMSRRAGPCVFGIVNCVRACGLMLSSSAALFAVVCLTEWRVSLGVVAAMVVSVIGYFVGHWHSARSHASVSLMPSADVPEGSLLQERYRVPKTF
jgi:hypothetical protein